MGAWQTPLAIGLTAALLVPLVAAASPITIRYVAGSGTPTSMLFCAHAAEVSIVGSADSVSLGGACVVDLLAGAGVTIEAIDAASGPVRFFYDLRVDGLLACAQGWALGPVTLPRAAGCDEISVAPQVGSMAGVVRLA